MSTQGFNLRFNGIIGFIFLVMLFVGLFFLAKGIFTLLAWISPVLIIGTLLINYRTLLNYFRFMLSLLQRNPLTGIVAIILSVIGFPILSGVLFGKAILDRKVKKLVETHQAREQGEYVEYEEVVPQKKEITLDLPPLEKEAPAPKPKDNRYEDLF
jgi:hypothetical protein